MIQYPKSEHVTLPSVESWGINNNIIKDPPKSIVTRRIDKVGDTQLINDWVDDSGDRVCEGILVYARGTNPFVAVSYDNFSNNAGMKGNLTNISNKPQVSLPYKAMRDGAFRPPIQNPRDLLPLSRQPRLVSSKFTNPGFADWSKNRECPSNKLREVKAEVLKTCVRPTAVFTLEKPIEPFSVNYSIIDSPLHYSMQVNQKGQDNTTLNVLEPTKGANGMNGLGYAHTNLGVNGMTKNVDVQFDTNKYIQNVNYTDMQSNLYSNVNAKDISECVNLDESRYIKDMILAEMNINPKGYEKIGDFQIQDERYVKEKTYIDYNTPLSGIEKHSHITDQIELNRVLPTWEARTNLGDARVNKTIEFQNELQLERNMPIAEARTNIAGFNRGDNMNAGSRDFKLPPSLVKGGFEGKATIPKLERTYEGESLNEQRRNFNKKVFSMYEGRYSN